MRGNMNILTDNQGPGEWEVGQRNQGHDGGGGKLGRTYRDAHLS